DDAVLPAVVDRVAPHHVGADVLAVPADLAGGEDALELVLVAGLVAALGGEVVAGGALLAERDGRARGVVDVVVLDYPALGPVRADEPGLVRRRRRPRGGGLAELEAAHGDVVDVVLGREEHRRAHVDLDERGVRVDAGEVGPHGGRVLADLGVPALLHLLGVALVAGAAGPAVDGGERDSVGVGDRLAAAHLVAAAALEVDLAEVHGRLTGLADEPVARHLDGERVALAEQAVGEGDAPDVAVLALPAGDPLGAGDPHVLALGGLEHDPAVLAAAAARGPHPLPVDAAVDDDGGAGGRELGGPLEGAQRVVGGPARGVGTGGGDVDDRHGSGVPLGRRWCGDEVGGVLDRRAPRGRRGRCCAGGSTTTRAPRAGVVRALLWEGCRHLG